MLELLAMFGWFDLGLLIGPLWNKFVSHKSKRAILQTGIFQPKQHTILDHQLQKYIGVEMNRWQKMAHRKSLSVIRAVVNTQAFEIVLAKGIKDKLSFSDRRLNTEVRI